MNLDVMNKMAGKKINVVYLAVATHTRTNP